MSDHRGNQADMYAGLQRFITNNVRVANLCKAVWNRKGARMQVCRLIGAGLCQYWLHIFVKKIPIYVKTEHDMSADCNTDANICKVKRQN